MIPTITKLLFGGDEMKDLIISLFGVYEPVMTQIAVTNEIEGVLSTELVDVVAAGAAGIDWPWIMGVLLFAIVLWSLFRILGVFFK